MSKIPFYFSPPTPKFFRDKGLLKNPKNLAFVTWCFERCFHEERIIFHDNAKITLEPYQFIFGRMVCSNETGLTENEVRTQQEKWENYGYLKKITGKTTNKTTKRFTVYEWVLTDIIKNDHQQNHQQNHQVTTKRPPSDHHNQEEEIIRIEKDHHPSPSSKVVLIPKDDLIDDDFFKNEEKNTQHNCNYQDIPQGKITEIYRNDAKNHLVQMTQVMLDECITIKGSLEAVKEHVEAVMNSPGRKSEIYNWPQVMVSWKVKKSFIPKMKENEAMSERLEREHENSSGWRCQVYFDRKKDQKGILFYSTHSTGNGETVFFSFSDPDFKKNVSKTLRDKYMQQGRISNS